MGEKAVLIPGRLPRRLFFRVSLVGFRFWCFGGACVLCAYSCVIFLFLFLFLFHVGIFVFHFSFSLFGGS